MTGRLSLLLAACIALDLTAAGSVSATPPTARTDSGVTDSKAERRDTRKGAEEHLRICCRAGPKIRYYYAHPQTCRERGHHVVRRHWCSGRKTSDKPGNLVCCVKSDVKLFPSPGFKSRGVVTTREKCNQRRGGWKAASSMRACAKKRTVSDRKRACEKRGKGWVWKDNRCVRAQLRDRRDP